MRTMLDALNKEWGEAGRDGGMQIMVLREEEDPAAYRTRLDWGVDMINCDHGDVVAQVAAAHAAEAAR